MEASKQSVSHSKVSVKSGIETKSECYKKRIYDELTFSNNTQMKERKEN